jgi:hypothetical protein
VSTVGFNVDLERVLSDLARLPFPEAVAHVDYMISLLRAAVVRRAELEPLPMPMRRALPPVDDPGLETINRILMSIAAKAQGNHT